MGLVQDKGWTILSVLLEYFQARQSRETVNQVRTSGITLKYLGNSTANAFDDLLDQLLIQSTYVLTHFAHNALPSDETRALLFACFQDFFHEVVASALLLHGWAPHYQGLSDYP